MSLHPHEAPHIQPRAILTDRQMAILSILQNEKFLRRRGLSQQDVRTRLLRMPEKKYVSLFGVRVPRLGSIHRDLKTLMAFGYAVVTEGKWKVVSRA